MLDSFQILTCPEGLENVIKLVKAVLNIIQIAIPIMLIVMGSIDLGRAVISSDEKEIKGATSKLIKRCIAAVAVFLVFTIVSLIMNLVANNVDENGNSWLECWRTGSSAADSDSNGR